jgi:hypothetical protein
VTARHGPWDVVIDDGGHRWGQQIAGAEALFPDLVDGGVYVVEDCHTSYWPEYSDPDAEAETFIDWVRRRIDDLNAHHHSRDLDLPTPWATSLDGVHVYDSVVVLDKAARSAPFGELSGASEYLYFGRDPLLATNEMRAARDQSIEARVAMEGEVERMRVENAQLAALGPELESTRGALTAVEEALARTQDELEGSRALIHEMRESTSWRMTEPLRRIRTIVSRG